MNKKQLGLFCVTVLWFFKSHAVVFATVEQTMQNIYSNKVSISKKNYFLSSKQLESLVKDLNLSKKTSRTNLFFEATKNGKVESRVFIDTHKVRTLNETLLIKINQKNQVEHIEILAFDEPKDYIAKDLWLKQLSNKAFTLDKNLMKQNIKPYMGATLTAEAIEKAVRKTLMLNQWMNQDKL